MPPAKKATGSKITTKSTRASSKKTVKITASKANTKSKTAVKSSATKIKSKATEKKASVTKLTPVQEKLYLEFETHPIDFEERCCTYLNSNHVKGKYGHAERNQIGGPDGGIDAYCIKYDDYDDICAVYYVQIKNKRQVGSNIIDSLSGAMDKYRNKITKEAEEDVPRIGIVMTSGVFTAEAKRAAKKMSRKIILIDGTEISKVR